MRLFVANLYRGGSRLYCTRGGSCGIDALSLLVLSVLLLYGAAVQYWVACWARPCCRSGPRLALSLLQEALVLEPLVIRWRLLAADLRADISHLQLRVRFVLMRTCGVMQHLHPEVRVARSLAVVLLVSGLLWAASLAHDFAWTFARSASAAIAHEKAR